MTIPPNYIPTQEAVVHNTLDHFDQPRAEAQPSAQESGYVGRLDPGMDVCDRDGNKLGTIGRVYRNETAPAGVDSSTVHGPAVIEVKTGPLGLGKHLWVPLSAVEDVTAGGVFIDARKEQINNQDWDVKPDYLTP